MKVIVEKEWYSVKMCKDNPQNCYIFGENEEQQRRGYSIRGSGQAIIRGQDNTYGFCTKKSIGEYWTDVNYSDNIICIEGDIKILLNLSKKYTLVFPYNGLGTGLSNMQQKCPRTFLYLSKRLLDVFGFNNLENLKSD